jgi:hypothetical protein
MIFDLGALVAGLVFLVLDKRRGVGALVLAYFPLLSLGHVPGVLPTQSNLSGETEGQRAASM